MSGSDVESTSWQVHAMAAATFFPHRREAAAHLEELIVNMQHMLARLRILEANNAMVEEFRAVLADARTAAGVIF